MIVCAPISCTNTNSFLGTAPCPQRDDDPEIVDLGILEMPDNAPDANIVALAMLCQSDDQIIDRKFDDRP